jgi:hypothetical protein
VISLRPFYKLTVGGHFYICVLCYWWVRARSSVWLEHPAHNRVVMGSNPFGPTINLFPQVSMKEITSGDNPRRMGAGKPAMKPFFSKTHRFSRTPMPVMARVIASISNP